MDKKTFLKKLDFVPQNISSNIYDKLILAKKTNKNTYTNEFYTPNIWQTVQNMKYEIDLNVQSFGIFKDAERRMILFSMNDCIEDYPIDLIKINIKSKFSKLSHRDYLGALMSLGLKREKFGDLILNGDEGCYFCCSNDISDYVKMNFNSVKNLNCSVDILDFNTVVVPEYKFEELVINVPSMRLDSIVGSICNLSRSKAEMIIKSGKVQLDYFECTKKDKILKDNSTIIIRGYGKFKFVEEIGHTGKGRNKLLIKKFS
ncbi:RNA-binding protein YlmH [Clostridium algifaecis]|uniref:RNA-binding protein YlmH n=1 Tax=Clostridium algifaecis TaxID=1472040 RepID=A0ABS4KN24_9CLOT|nr:YlmH/Sll1252 family protein [Clostridium algifaecis]MBP2031443.1 RNA-binding protein YlmH [Clostridium algifaecis]